MATPDLHDRRRGDGGESVWPAAGAGQRQELAGRAPRRDQREPQAYRADRWSASHCRQPHTPRQGAGSSARGRGNPAPPGKIAAAGTEQAPH